MALADPHRKYLSEIGLKVVIGLPVSLPVG